MIAAADELDAARAARDRAIRAARRADASVHNIAIAAGLSRQAIYNICDDA